MFEQKYVMFKSFREVEEMFDTLKSQYMSYLHILSLEIKNVRLNTDRIVASYYHHLSRVKSTRNDVHKSLSSQIQCLEKKQSKSKFCQNQILIAEEKTDIVLHNEMVYIINENTHNFYDL